MTNQEMLDAITRAYDSIIGLPAAAAFDPIDELDPVMEALAERIADGEA